MLKEIHDVKKEETGSLRRWFSDANLDLYVWYDNQQDIVQFQICYDKGPDEKAVTWDHKEGLLHHTVDDGTSGMFRMKSTPILTSNNESKTDHVCVLFTDAAQKLEHDLYQFIFTKLKSKE